MTPSLVSVHGGHSGEFCNHAQDTLAEIVRAYLERGFAWVGLTEHMPPVSAKYLYPEERDAGLDPQSLRSRFGRYITEARRLQEVYRDRMAILVGFETEAYTGSLAHIEDLIAEFRPDYIVGSVHHVNDIPFDYSAGVYQKAVAASGGIQGLYCTYFDIQYDLIQRLHPSVVAHFDLIRLFDPDYPTHLRLPEVRERISRNLALIQKLDLMLDFNVSALRKGAEEPYLSRDILAEARSLGIAVVPADDSHGVDSVGACLTDGIALLQEMGFDTRWPRPKPCHP